MVAPRHPDEGLGMARQRGPPTGGEPPPPGGRPHERFLGRARPIAGGLKHSAPTGRRLTRLGIALIVVVVGLGWPVGAAVTPADAPHATIAASVVDAPRQIEPGGGHPAPVIPRPRPLAPAPPLDGRDAPDPFVLADGDRYLLYSTQVGFHNVPVATSPDLRRWSAPVDALPQLPPWATWGRTWAPGVTLLGGHYLLYFAAHDQRSGRQCIGAATSTKAEGPFAPAAGDPLVCQTDLGGSIDPYPVVAPDGTATLLWKADGNAVGLPSTLFAQPLRADGVALAGQPVALLRSGAAWEEPLIENPALIATGQSFVLLYSGGWWESRGYAIGYASCESQLGPCTKATVDGPLLASADGEAGPGGASVVTGPAGDQWLAYHAWAPDAVGYRHGGARSLHFAAFGPGATTRRSSPAEVHLVREAQA